MEDIAREGIPRNLVDNAIHQLELYRSEITGNSTPFGLNLFMRSALMKQHGGSAEFGLMIHSLFDELRKRLKENPRYLEELIEKYFIYNTHFAKVVFIPDQELAAREIAEEQKTLNVVKAHMNKRDLQKVLDKSAQLAAFQEKQKEMDAEVLPKVTLADVPKKSRSLPLARQTVGNLEVFHHSTFTNGIVYTDLIFDMPDLPEEDLPYVRLFAMLLSQMGVGGRSYAENLEYIQGHTGGVGAALGLNIQGEDHTQFIPTFQIKGKALHRKVEKLFTLLQDIVTSVDFTDIPRLKEVILKHYTALESTIAQSSMKYATSLSASGLNVAGKVSNDWYGLNYFWMIRDLAHHFDDVVGELLAKLQGLQHRLLGLKGAHLLLTCEDAIFQEMVKAEFYGLSHLQNKPFIPWKGLYPLPRVVPQGRVIASPVAFTSKVFSTVSYVHPDAPALSIAAFLFDNVTLHTRLREQGGAYGGGAVSSAAVGQFYFYAYRDPNISSTLEAFEDAVKDIVDGNFDEADLEEAKLEMVQALDAPIAPGSRGDVAYGWFREGRTQEMRQAFRDRLLSLTRQHVQEAVARQIVPNFPKGSAVVFAGRELLEKEVELMKQQGKPLLSSIDVI